MHASIISLPTGNLASVPGSPLKLPKQISHVLQVTQSGDLYWNVLEAFGTAGATSCQEARPHLALQLHFLLLRLLRRVSTDFFPNLLLLRPLSNTSVGSSKGSAHGSSLQNPPFFFFSPSAKCGHRPLTPAFKR